MAKRQDSTEPEDFSSEIQMELRQLISLSEMLMDLPDPAEKRENFFLGLAEMIAGAVDRIESMLNPTYDYLSEQSTEWVFSKIQGLKDGCVLLRVPQKWMQREKRDWRLLAEQTQELMARRTIPAQERRIHSMGVAAFGAVLWDYLEKHEVTFDNLNLIAADVPAVPWA